MSKSNSTYDFVVIGGGAAGSAVAGLLAERSTSSVLVLEAGPSDKGVFHEMPGAVIKVMGKVWGYAAEADENLGGRAIPVPQGKVLGGGSAVNGMIYIRGQKEDYDGWAQDLGCTDWGYDQVLPYFKKAEKNDALSGEYHGTEGHLSVSENRNRHPLMQAFVRAGQEVGLPYTTDFNGADQKGVGFYQTTTKRGERASASQAYLRDTKPGSNLTVETEAKVKRIVIENGVATGVEYWQNGKLKTASAKREVVLSAGAIGSPQLLMLSGVGPAEELARHDIPVHQDLPVGQNYHDHLCVSIHVSLKEPISMFGEEKGHKGVKHAAEWKAFKSGILSSNILEAGAFFNTNDEGTPDVQIHAMPVLLETNGIYPEMEQHGMTLKVGQLRPKSRGTVTLRSSDPEDLPVITGNYFHEQEDVDCTVRGLRQTMEFFEAPSLKEHVKDVIWPTAETMASDVEIEKYVRSNVATVFHPVGTCKMGTDPAHSVVDLSLRVWGIERLRVVDASVMPSIPSGNTNGPTNMIAERAADFIMGNH
jgi:choline dehydrogenase